MRLKTLSFTGGAFAENGFIALCEETGEAVVIDPGAAAPEMVDALKGMGADLVAILLTHAHLDHVEGVPAVLDAWPVPVHLHAADRPLYDQAGAQAEAFGLPVPTLPPPDRALEHGGSVTFGARRFDVRHAPGHAPGHVLLHDQAEGVAFSGDLVFQGSIGRSDLPGGDFRQLIDSIRGQVLTLPDDTRLLTGHGPETTVGHERRHNPFLAPQYGGELA